MDTNISCPICGAACSLLDVVDFNKSCEESRGKFLPLSGIPIYYALCDDCDFCFAPEFSAWTLSDFENKIYNAEYVQVDPDYLDARPRAAAENLISTLGEQGTTLRHLDYGGGNGLLSGLLVTSGWNSTSYDPLVNKGIAVQSLGRFDLITAYEVFEHVPDVADLMLDLSSLLEPEGVVLFSTLLSDGQFNFNERLSWWYAAPRNGHISLFSRHSIAILAQKYGFNFSSFSEGSHALWKKLPDWAGQLIP